MFTIRGVKISDVFRLGGVTLMQCRYSIPALDAGATRA